MNTLTHKAYCIIVTHNGEKYIEKCLQSLFESNCSMQIIVIDNKSTDNTVRILKKYNEHIYLICLKQNLGFGKANNLGLKYSFENKAEYIFLLNQDVYVTKNTIHRLIELSINNPRFGIISPLHLNGKGEKVDTLFATFIAPPACDLFTDVNTETNSIRDVYDCGFVNAAAWLITRSCYQSVGGFDPIFYHYGEDDDYIKRVLFKGFSVGVTPESHIYHDRGAHKLNTYSQYYQKKLGYYIELKDLRLNYFSIFAKTVIDISKMMWKDLVDLHIINAAVKLRLVLNILSNFSKIKRHRNKCISDKSPFIID